MFHREILCRKVTLIPISQVWGEELIRICTFRGCAFVEVSMMCMTMGVCAIEKYVKLQEK